MIRIFSYRHFKNSDLLPIIKDLKSQGYKGCLQFFYTKHSVCVFKNKGKSISILYGKGVYKLRIYKTQIKARDPHSLCKKWKKYNAKKSPR